jgi:multidrug efflux pump subunit AcrA (membrane-fusion protein)
MEELAQAQARTEVRMEELAQAQARTEVRMEELAQAQTRTEVRMEELAQAQTRTEVRMEELAQAQTRTEVRVGELAKDLRELAIAQRATEVSLKALVDTVKGMNDRLGKLDGDALERRYRERGQAYFMRLARRLRPIDHAALSPLVDDAELDGRLTTVEANAILLADGIFSGRARSDGSPVHLLFEASVTIAHHDVRRARERADLLARIVDTPVIAVVAGEYSPEPVLLAAQDADVWTVTNGRALGPTEDLDAYLR